MLVVVGAGFLGGLMVVFVVVNGSFGVVLIFVMVLVVASRGYVFCGFYSMSLLLMRFSYTWVLDGVACLRCDFMGC
jgi:hypothetical protein